ncbi:RNA polymerase sigma factor [Planosporangium flavigriseum]|uniref:RNA polymerase sigma factor n=1 Tax=Planosporangium flavigriseum TaxID=373681 RepID=UPI001EF36D5A|nr:RNA polymerase sigma factor [Planosporangium flavigriseum]
MTEVEPRTARPTDLSPLVSAAQQGDQEAFRALYRAVQPGLLRYLKALVADDAEDVASETWLQISRDLRTFRGKEGFRAWAATIGRNRAMDHLRHRKRRPAVSTPIEQMLELPSAWDTADSASESISTDSALALIRTLPRDQAEAVLLRVVVGLDAETAGKVLGKRAGAIRTASYRGLRRLAEQLDQRAGGRDRHPDAGVTDPSSATPTGTT